MLKYKDKLYIQFNATQRNLFRAFQFKLSPPPIEHRVGFKFANITFNTLHYSQPAYL